MPGMNPADAAFRQALGRISSKYKVEAFTKVPPKDRKEFWTQVHALAESMRQVELGFYVRYNKGERVMVNMGPSWANPEFHLGTITRVTSDLTYVVLDDSGSVQGFRPTKSGVGIVGRARGNVKANDVVALKDVPDILDETSPFYGKPYGITGDSPFFMNVDPLDDPDQPSLSDEADQVDTELDPEDDPDDPAYRPTEEEQDAAAKKTKDKDKAAKEDQEDPPSDEELAADDAEDSTDDDEDSTDDSEDTSNDDDDSGDDSESSDDSEDDSDDSSSDDSDSSDDSGEDSSDDDSGDDSSDDSSDDSDDSDDDEEKDPDGPPGEGEKECDRCGANNPDDARYCFRCGEKFDDVKDTETASLRGRTGRFITEVEMAIGMLTNVRDQMFLIPQDSQLKILQTLKATSDTLTPLLPNK